MLRPWGEKKERVTFGKITSQLYGKIKQHERNYVDSSTLATERFNLAFLFEKERQYEDSHAA
jgi:hypothetical protein